jgi:hypothetical protein
MHDFTTIDLVRQQRDHLDRAAAHARLVREARPRKKHGEGQDR